MTPRRDQLSPKSVLAWLKQTRKLIERRGNDKAVKFKVHYMFKYIQLCDRIIERTILRELNRCAEQLVEYQDPLPPQIDSEDGSQFTCRRCKKAMQTDEGGAEDYIFCPLCGQRWKGERQ